MNIHKALNEAHYGRGYVYVQDQSGDWIRIYQARNKGFILYVRALSSGKWFVPQQWETRD